MPILRRVAMTISAIPPHPSFGVDAQDLDGCEVLNRMPNVNSRWQDCSLEMMASDHTIYAISSRVFDINTSKAVRRIQRSPTWKLAKVGQC